MLTWTLRAQTLGVIQPNQLHMHVPCVVFGAFKLPLPARASWDAF